MYEKKVNVKNYLYVIKVYVKNCVYVIKVYVKNCGLCLIYIQLIVCVILMIESG